MKRPAATKLRLVWKFPDGSKMSMPLVDHEQALQRQYHSMATSDSPELREAGERLLREAAERSAGYIAVQAQSAAHGFSSGKERAAAKQPTWERWQARANELKAANPRLSKSAICQRIAQEEGLDPSGRGVAKRIEIVGTERPRSKK